jgi:chemotaxis protein methyltransferase CheR
VPEQPELGNLEFKALRDFVRLKSGIQLGDDKAFLAVTRLTPLLWRHKLKGFGELVAGLALDGNGTLAQETLDLMTTNETWFFRDAGPFDGLREEILPGLLKSRGPQRKLRVWSAASSAGQEAYSMAMTLLHYFDQVRSWDVKIIGTDISEAMLERVRKGEYDQFEVNRGLPLTMMVKYFEQVGLKWAVKPDLRRLVEPRALNLNAAWPPLPRFDVIFLRNVLIYFDQADKRKIMERMAYQLAPDGALFLGGSEMMEDLSDRFIPVNLKRGRYFKLK